MLKRILTILWEGTIIILLVLLFIYQSITIQNLKKELSYISQEIEIIGHQVENFKKDTLADIKRDVALTNTIVELINLTVSNDTELQGMLNTLKDNIGLQRIIDQNKINTIIEDTAKSLKNDIKEQRLSDEMKTDLKIENVEIKIENQLVSKATKLEELENNFHSTNVLIMNEKVGQGSGSWIKYKNKFYILSAGHLVDTNEDTLYAMENEEFICELKIIKVDHKRDIALFASEDPNYVPKTYTELADEETKQGSEIYVVGNPMGIEDVISKGRIIKYRGFYCFFQDHSYFGSSGGGIYNLDGKLIGVIVYIIAENPMGVESGLPPFVVHGAIRLNMLRAFLGDIK
jgi:S1-C subfamily serine protease